MCQNAAKEFIFKKMNSLRNRWPQLRSLSERCLTKILAVNYGTASPAADCGFKIQHMKLDDSHGFLSIKWDDGTKGEFPYVWLRDCSPDPVTYHITPAIKARKLLMMDLDPELKPEGAEVAEDGARVNVRWPGGVDAEYSSDWLRFRNPVDEDKRRRRRAYYLDTFETWGASEIAEKLPVYPFDDVMTNDKALHDCLLGICRLGIGLLKDAPTEPGVLKMLEERVGYVTTTHFGPFFTVMSKPDGVSPDETKDVNSNLAYTSLRLGLHTDQPCLVRNPEVQLLHCIKQTKEAGGENEFADAFRVAEQLRLERPEFFHLLTTTPVEYIEEGWDFVTFDNLARHKILDVDENGNAYGCSFSNQMRSWFYDIPVEKVRPMYRAMKAFIDYCYQDRNLLRRKSEEGDIIVFANNRVLHGRTAYESNPQDERHLEGCYFSWDILRSRIRAIRDNLNLPENQPSA